MDDERTPSAPNIQKSLAGLQLQLAADKVQLAKSWSGHARQAHE